MFADILAECVYRLNRDTKKWAIVLLIMFFAGFTAGFCAGKVVEDTITIQKTDLKEPLQISEESKSHYREKTE